MTKAELGQRLTDNVMAMDANACAACYARDAELVSPLGIARGRDEIRQFFTGWFEAFEDFDIVDDLSEEGDTLYCDSVCKATHVAPMKLPNGETLPATGQRVTINAHEVTVWEGEVIKRHTMEYDAEAMLAQLKGAGGGRMTKPELVARLTNRVMTLDADACAECYTDDAQLRSPAGTVSGKDDIREFFGGWFQSFSDVEITEELTEEDGEVSCVAVNWLTHSAPLELPSGETLPATGKRIRIDARERYSFDGDLIKTHLMEYDPEQMMSQLTG